MDEQTIGKIEQLTVISHPVSINNPDYKISFYCTGCNEKDELIKHLELEKQTYLKQIEYRDEKIADLERELASLRRI